MSSREFSNPRYEPIRRIARGGMAEVYLARDTKLDRPVALKVLFPELSTDPSFVERFRREAQAAANLSHPNIVSIYDWGEDNGTYYIVMEYVEGEPLSALIRREGPLLADRAAGIGASVAAALHFAHRNGVVHRDVKPGNVLITLDGHVEVTDFGIARAANTSGDLTQTGAVMGTATYFSPEQAQGFGVDARSDVYSLGVVLYEMVTAHPPFSADGPMAVAFKHVHEAVPPPRSIVPTLPAAFETIVMHALAKDSANRYPSAERLRMDLTRFRQGRPIMAPDWRTRGQASSGPVTRTGGARGGAPRGAASAAQGERATQAVTMVAPVADARSLAAGAGPPTTVVGAAPPSRRSSTWIYVALLAVLLAALVVVLYLLGRSLGAFGNSSTPTSATSVAVPTDLVGQPEAAASTELTRLGLVAKPVNQPSTQANGTVFALSPDPGTKLAKGSTVQLDVSSGPGGGLGTPAATVTVPSVIGELYPHPAGDQLLSAGLTVSPNFVWQANRAPRGTVLEEEPGPGTQASSGEAVVLTVSTGQIAVPDVVGQPEDAAANALDQAGLRSRVTDVSSTSVPRGDVISTDPSAGTQVDPGTVVTIDVSTGPGLVSVPNVVGDTEAQARTALSNAGFTVAETTVTVVDPAQNGIVQSQTPVGGSMVTQGSTVTITLGKFA